MINFHIVSEQNVVVSDEMVADALSNYGRSPDGLLRVFLDVKLIGTNLVDINNLAKYVYLQKVILSYNKITGTVHA